MNRKNRVLRGAILTLLMLSLVLTAGCGKKPDAPAGSGEPAPTQAPAVPGSAENTQSGAAPADGGGEPSAPADDALHVNSVEALLATIAPGAKIVLEPGRYDFTDFLRDYPNARDCDEWNDEHPYVKLGMVFDGVEVTITDVDGLSIAGGADDPAETEIVTEPRYAAVLNLENCSDVELACLTMGHTETGDCSGNVLDLDNCRDIYLRTMDLYGCGVYGVCAQNGCGGVYVSNSTIRDCAYGSVDISEGEGEFLFTACVFNGSGWGGNYEAAKRSSLSFVGCFFGEGESNGWYFRNDVSFENCEWSEITSYPDREETLEDSYGFYPETMEQISFDELEGHTNWVGFAVVDPQSGETEYPGLMGQDAMPSLIASLDLNGDGTGVFAFRTESYTLDPEQSDDVLCLRGDERNIYLSLWRMRDPEYPEYCYDWLMMRYDDAVVWFF